MAKKKMKIVAKSTPEKAEIERSEMLAKGFTVEVQYCSVAYIIGTDVGGQNQVLRDIDDEMYMVIGTKS